MPADLLFKIAEVVVTIPHSNAWEERIFLHKQKLNSKQSFLSLIGTLSSIIIVKTHIENPLQWNPTESLLQAAKKATRNTIIVFHIPNILYHTLTPFSS